MLKKTVMQFVKGEIQSADLVKYVLEANCVDTIMHFAAQVGMRIPSSGSQPVSGPKGF